MSCRLWPVRQDHLPAEGRTPRHVEPETAVLDARTMGTRTLGILEGLACRALGSRGAQRCAAWRSQRRGSSIGTAPGGRPLQMERSAWEHSAESGGRAGTQPAARSAAQLRGRAGTPPQREAAGPWEQPRTQAGAGQRARVTATRPSLARSPPGKKSEMRPRSYTPFTCISPKAVCVWFRENHKAVLLFLSSLQPQPVRAGL